MQFRKRPLVIEAARWDGSNENEIQAFMGGYLKRVIGGMLFIGTLEGIMCASVGDYIIKGVKGEFYSCKPDIFAETYEDATIDPESLRPQWVSVYDKLPTAGERVLATDGAFVGEMYINSRGQWQRYNVNDSALMMALDILWWQPMPKPPEMKGE